MHRWPIYLIGLTWTIPMVYNDLNLAILFLLTIPITTDTRNKLPDPHFTKFRIRHVSDESTRDPCQCFIHPSTSFLDLVF